MRKLFILLVSAVMMLTFISCERTSEISPIKGVWKCSVEMMNLTLEYGDYNVKYTFYIKQHKATAIYEGTYTIMDNVIKHEFNSLTTKNCSRVGFIPPDQLKMEAILKDNNTIINKDVIFTRE